MEIQSYRKILRQEFGRRKQRNPRYSLRSFARDIKISTTTLSQVLNNKRSMSRKNLLRLADILGLSPTESAAFLNENYSKRRTSQKDYFLLQEDYFRLISDWHHMAILCLADMKKNNSSPVWIAKRLNISVTEAKTAVDRLLRMNLVQIHHNKLKSTNVNIKTPSNVPSSARRKYHAQNLELARRALENIPFNNRDMSSSTMVIDVKDIPKAKELIQNFRKQFSKKIENLSGSEVYTLAVQFFPVTHGG